MSKQLVVAAALRIRDRILACRRSYPPKLAGLWEFPGGKVEPGESPIDALRREVREELAIEIELGAEVAAPRRAAWPINDRYEMRVWWAYPVAGLPRRGADHDRLRWLPADRLAELNWLPADIAIVAQIAASAAADAGTLAAAGRPDPAEPAPE